MKSRLLLVAMFATFLLFVVGCTAPAPTSAPTSPPPTVAPVATRVPPTAAPAATTAPTVASTSAPTVAAATATTAPTKPPATATTSAPPKLSMTDVVMVSSSVSPPSITNIYYYGAIDGGFFKKYGLNVTAQQSGGSPLSLAAITSGTAQFASVNMTTLSNAVAEGAKLKLVVTGNFDFPGSVLVNDKIKTEQDLSTAIFATSSIGSNEYNIPLTYLKAKGIDTSKIQWVATGSSPLSIQAVAAGRADATWSPQANVVDGLNKFPQLRALIDPKTIAAASPTSGGIIVVTEDFMAKYPDVIQAFVTAVIEGNRYLQESEANYAKIANARMPGIYSEKDIHSLYEAYAPSFGVNGGLAFNVLNKDFEIWRTQVNPEAAKKSGLTGADQLVEKKFVSVALDKLGIIKGQLDTASWK